ncbi:hypothetical protein GW17_00001629 [Ensete ventricosum]|nr:hypothetical protein GW17_00001629 [Ensete ventricosum]
MRELPLESVRPGIVKTKTLSTRVSVSPTAGLGTYPIPRRDEEEVAVVGEAEVGDAIGGRVGELPPAGGRKSGGAHSGRKSERVRGLTSGGSKPRSDGERRKGATDNGRSDESVRSANSKPARC